MAHGAVKDGLLTVYVADAGAAFTFMPSAAVVEAVCADTTRTLDLRDAFESLVLPIYFHVSGAEALHGSAIATSRGVVGFCAMSGTGKSTLACGLAARGFPVWADDAIVFNPASDSVETLSIPFQPKLRSESLAEFGATPADGQVDPGREARLSAILLLEQAEPGTAISLDRLRPGPALEGLLPHAYRFGTSKECRQRVTANYLSLVSNCVVAQLRFPADFNVFDELLDRVEDFILDL